MASIVDVDPRRPGSRLPPTNRFADSSDDEEDEEERRLAEDEEQERLLSEQHGEAEESATATRNKRQSETDIEAEYGSTAKKVKRPTLTPAILMGPKGLIRIRSEFGRKVRWPSSCKRREDAAAAYSRSLIQMYKSFCYDLFPASAFQDVLTRIESFGSKKEVKTYLQTMREEIRNNHLENVYGKEKANHMIQELEHGLKQQHEMDHDEIAMGVNANEDENRRGPVLRSNDPKDAELPTGGTSSAPVTTEKATQSQADKSSSNEAAAEKEFTFGDDLQDTDDELEIVAPRKASSTQGPLQKTAPTNPFESDDEEELEENESGTNKAEQENASVGTTANDKDASPNDGNVGAKELQNVHGGSSDPEEEQATSPTCSDETATIVATMETQTQLESPEQDDEDISSVVVQENPSTPTGAWSLDDETSTVVATMDTQLESPYQEDEQDTPIAPEDLLTPAREQEPTSTCDETPTVVATMETQLDSPEHEEEKEESLTPTTQEPTSTSDEIATTVATMETQLESPEQKKI
jgi:hypothetical protein